MHIILSLLQCFTILRTQYLVSTAFTSLLPLKTASITVQSQVSAYCLTSASSRFFSFQVLLDHQFHLSLSLILWERESDCNMHGMPREHPYYIHCYGSCRLIRCWPECGWLPLAQGPAFDYGFTWREKLVNSNILNKGFVWKRHLIFTKKIHLRLNMWSTHGKLPYVLSSTFLVSKSSFILYNWKKEKL